MSRRRHALLLGGLALVLGGLAASNVAGREAALTRRVGDLVDVVVAREPIHAGSPVRPTALAVRRVPRRFAPADAIGSPRALSGLRAAVDIPQHTDLTPAMVGAGRPAPLGPSIGRGERAAEVVGLGSPELVTPGSRVDVLVTPEPGSGEAGAAVLALEDVEVLAVAPAQGEDGPASTAKAAPGTRINAALRVTLRQAVYLAAAQDFAREIRLLPRAAGDRRRGAAGLRMAAG
ncbi:MAG: pilus assembly protein CpaB [Solirubrobacteraceae bacterium]|jgi:pilus assembly protein CpaB|nr:pilus assembly protein CpaB [Solirubrobacteraceae bacterium]